MTYQKHMSFAESVTETGRTNYSDGSARITYQIVASQYIDILGRSSAATSTQDVALATRPPGRLH